MKLLRWILGFAITLVIVVFATSNLHNVLLYPSQFNDPISQPLYLIALGFMSAGFVIGSFMVWCSLIGTKKENKALHKNIKELEKQLEEVLESAENTIEINEALPSQDAISSDTKRLLHH